MKLSFVQKVLFKGALKKDTIFKKVAYIFAQAVFLVSTGLFLFFYITRKDDSLFIYVMFFLFAFLTTRIIITYQCLIKKIKQEIDKSNIALEID